MRVDSAHIPAGQNLPEFISDEPKSSIPFRRMRDPSAMISGRHVIGFGLLVFLIGQSILMWAFITGHFGAWTVANLISVAGLAIALLAASSSMRRLENRIDQLARQLATPSKKRTRNQSREKRRDR